jgi:hypothetical protein
MIVKCNDRDFSSAATPFISQRRDYPLNAAGIEVIADENDFGREIYWL